MRYLVIDTALLYPSLETIIRDTLSTPGSSRKIETWVDHQIVDSYLRGSISPHLFHSRVYRSSGSSTNSPTDNQVKDKLPNARKFEAKQRKQHLAAEWLQILQHSREEGWLSVLAGNLSSGYQKLTRWQTLEQLADLIVLSCETGKLFPEEEFITMVRNSIRTHAGTTSPEKIVWITEEDLKNKESVQKVPDYGSLIEFINFTKNNFQKLEELL